MAADAKILVLDGYTTNVPLILMGRKGWTVNWTTRENIREGMERPFDIVAMQNSFSASDVLKNDSTLVNRLEKFADNGWISLFRKKEDPGRTFDQFFGIDTINAIFLNSRTDSIRVDKEQEFLELLSDTAGKFVSNQPVKVLITGKIKVERTAAPQLNGSISNGVTTTHYFSFDLKDYTNVTSAWQNIMFQFVFPPHPPAGAEAKVYFWNNHKTGFYLKDLRLVVYR